MCFDAKKAAIATNQQNNQQIAAKQTPTDEFVPRSKEGVLDYTAVSDALLKRVEGYTAETSFYVSPERITAFVDRLSPEDFDTMAFLFIALDDGFRVPANRFHNGAPVTAKRVSQRPSLTDIEDIIARRLARI